MEEILKTTLLEFEKSTFILDIVMHESGKQYIRILQTIQDESTTAKRAIKINPSLLSDILKVLNSYHELICGGIENQQTKQTSSDFASTSVTGKIISESDVEAIKNRYLKGVSIVDLSIQFDCKAQLIEQVLRNGNIAIVDSTQPKPFKYRKLKRKPK